MHKKNQNIFKQAVLCLFRCIFLLFVLWLVLHKHYKEIYVNMSRMQIGPLILILLMGMSYQILGAAAFYLLVKKNNPQFTMRESIETVYLGFFGNIAAFSFGSVPMRTYYLHTHQIDAGKAMGLINTDYMLHKSSVLICSTVLLLFVGLQSLDQWKTILKYIIFGYMICFSIIILLFLIGFSKKVYQWIRYIVMLLPDKKKWKIIKEKTIYHLEMMHGMSEEIKNSGKTIVFILILHCIKLWIMYAIPFICMKSITNTTASFFEIQTLVALTNLISSALPNVSGIGAAELAFFLIFENFMTGASIASVLVLYRLATYFVPFLISIVVFNRIERKRIKER